MTDSAVTLIFTEAGLARFAAAQLGAEGLDLMIASVGLTDAEFVQAPTLTALPGEFRRVPAVSGAVVGSDIVHLMLRDDEAVSYHARGFGLFLADGTLFAFYGQADRLFEKSLQSSLNVAIDITFPLPGVDHLTFGDANWLNPPATETTAGVARIGTMVEVEAANATDRIVTPATLGRRLAEVVSSLLASIAHTVADYVPLAQKAVANGVSTLGGDGLIPATQLPLVALFRPGMITLFVGAVAPAGWALCNGQVALWADGSGNVTTPDLRGRVPVGASDDHGVGTLFGQSNSKASTTNVGTGVALNFATSSGYAGGGTQTAVAAGAQGTAPSLTDAGHAHSVTIDVTQPSIALNYIMKL